MNVLDKQPFLCFRIKRRTKLSEIGAEFSRIVTQYPGRRKKRVTHGKAFNKYISCSLLVKVLSGFLPLFLYLFFLKGVSCYRFNSRDARFVCFVHFVVFFKTNSC